MGEKELQEKILTYRLFEARLDGLMKQRDMLINKAIELQATLGSIGELDKANVEILFPIGGEAYKAGKAANNGKLIVEIGAGIALEKSTAEGKAILEKRRKEIEGTVNKMQHEILSVSNAINQLGPELQDMAKQFQQSEAG